MNWNHDDGCGAQKSVRCGDVIYTQLMDSNLIRQTDVMVCDACGDIWYVDTKFDPEKEGLSAEQLCRNDRR